MRQELRQLAGLGLIVARKDDNRTYYQANRRHPIYPDIRNLVLKTSGLVEILRQALHDTDIGVAFVFGSLASCAEQAHSDVDLMILSHPRSHGRHSAPLPPQTRATLTVSRRPDYRGVATAESVATPAH